MKCVNIALAVVAGALVGASVGLLLAPKKGSDTRAEIKKYLRGKAKELRKGELDEIVNEVAGSVRG